MRGQQGNGFGARRRFLAEQNEHMLAIGHEPVCKKLTPSTLANGAAHEQYSAEGKRRKIVASEMGWSGTAAGAGTVATGATAARLAGTGTGQAYLSGRQKLTRSPEAKASLERLKRVGQSAARNPLKTSALAGGAAGVAAVAGRVARMRSNEEAGMSHEIGRMKGGSQYRRDLQRISKSRLAANMLVELDRGAPQLKKLRDVARARPKTTAAAVGTPTVSGGLYESQRRGRLRRAEYLRTKEELSKKDRSLETKISKPDSKRLVSQYGLKGPLPKGLSREQKMAAYEARYVRAGGKRAEKWQGRATTADKVKNVGIGVATAGGAAWLGTRRGSYKSISAARKAGFRHHADNVAVGGGVAAGAGEIYGDYARRKRSSYASAPGGVAASALRRMRAYTPEGKN